MEDVSKQVLSAMVSAGKPLKPGEIADAAGLPKEVVDKAIAALKKQGLIVSPKRCFYAPADQ